MRAAFEADDVTAMVRKVFADRVTFHDDDSTIGENGGSILVYRRRHSR